jgi:hypothetical protein
MKPNFRTEISSITEIEELIQSENALSSVVITAIIHCPEGGDSKNFRNVGKLPPHYMAQQPRKQSSSYSTP